MTCSDSPQTRHLIKVKLFPCGIISKERMRKIKHCSNDNNDTPNINKQEDKPWWFVGALGSFLSPDGPWLLADLGAGAVAGE